MGWRMRTADDMAALHREAAADAAVPAAGGDAPQRTARQQQVFSTHPPARGDEAGEWNTAWDGTDFGANKGGICVAAGPDPMHVLMEGLAEDIRKWTVTRAREQNPRTDGVLDERFARMAVQPEFAHYVQYTFMLRTICTIVIPRHCVQYVHLLHALIRA